MPRTIAFHDYETFAEVLAQIGDIPPDRYRNAVSSFTDRAEGIRTRGTG